MFLPQAKTAVYGTPNITMPQLSSSNLAAALNVRNNICNKRLWQADQRSNEPDLPNSKSPRFQVRDRSCDICVIDDIEIRDAARLSSRAVGGIVGISGETIERGP